MSMDLEVWSATAPELPAVLPEALRWKRYGSDWAFESEDWQVLVSPEQSDDAPEEVSELVANAAYRTGVTLEPIDAAPAGYALLETVVRGIARASRGVWVDPNGDVFAHDQGSFE